MSVALWKQICKYNCLVNVCFIRSHYVSKLTVIFRQHPVKQLIRFLNLLNSTCTFMFISFVLCFMKVYEIMLSLAFGQNLL